MVLTPQEVESVLNGLKGVLPLMAGLWYGSGLRLMECLRLWVQDVDFGYRGKSGCVTPEVARIGSCLRIPVQIEHPF
jgi:integrase